MVFLTLLSDAPVATGFNVCILLFSDIIMYLRIPRLSFVHFCYDQFGFFVTPVPNKKTHKSQNNIHENRVNFKILKYNAQLLCRFVCAMESIRRPID